MKSTLQNKSSAKTTVDFLCSFATLMVYKIPMEDVKSLAKAFSQLESGESHTPQPSGTLLLLTHSVQFIFLISVCLQPSNRSTLKSTTSPSRP